MADLITNARARMALPTANATPGSPDDLAITALIKSASVQIEKYCRRTFGSTAYDELYSGTGSNVLMLKNFPIISIQSVRFRPASVLKIRNADTATNQRARVTVGATTITLAETASAVITSHALTLATYPTLTALAAEINNSLAVYGWQAQVSPGYELFPSTDLYPPIQGAQNAAGVWCDLRMHVDELSGFQVDPAHGYLTRSIVVSDPDVMLPSDPIWPSGLLNFRVQYTAGFATVPENIQEACAQMVAAYFRLDAREIAGTPVPSSVRALVLPYRSRTIMSLGA